MSGLTREEMRCNRLFRILKFESSSYCARMIVHRTLSSRWCQQYGLLTLLLCFWPLTGCCFCGADEFTDPPPPPARPPACSRKKTPTPRSPIHYCAFFFSWLAALFCRADFVDTPPSPSPPKRSSAAHEDPPSSPPFPLSRKRSPTPRSLLCRCVFVLPVDIVDALRICFALDALRGLAGPRPGTRSQALRGLQLPRV